jgi:hypothetical protein
MAINKLNVIRALTDSPAADIRNFICNHLENYQGANTCKITLSTICQQDDLTKLINAADKCVFFPFSNTAPVYQCNSYNLLTTGTSLPQTAATVINGVSSTTTSVDYTTVVNSVGTTSDLVVRTVELVQDYVTVYHSGRAIVPYAPTNFAELYEAIQTCGEWHDCNQLGVYNPNQCSGVAGIPDYAACVGALLSVSPAWEFPV